jgi:hypothetical protein
MQVLWNEWWPGRELNPRRQPFQGFSEPNPFSINNFIRQGGPFIVTSTVEKSIGRPINPTVYSVAEFKSKLASGNHFLTAVLKGQKVFLLGDEALDLLLD